MIGRRWTTGITLRYMGNPGPAWSGFIDFLDEGVFQHPSPDRISTEGQLSTRYYGPAERGHREVLTAVTDTLIQEAEQLGIEFRDPYIYAEADGEDPKHPLPEGWVDLFEEQAQRLGWGMPAYEWHRQNHRVPRLQVVSLDDSTFDEA